MLCFCLLWVAPATTKEGARISVQEFASLNDGALWNFKLSPDGQYLAWIEKKEGRHLIKVAKVENRNEPVRVIEIADDSDQYVWAADSHRIIRSLNPIEGRARLAIYEIETNGEKILTLDTPSAFYQAANAGADFGYLYIFNKSSRSYDLYRLDHRAQHQYSILETNPGNVSYWWYGGREGSQYRLIVDAQGSRGFQRQSDNSWRTIFSLEPLDRVALLTSLSNDTALALSNRNRRSTAFVRINLENGEEQTLLEDPNGLDVVGGVGDSSRAIPLVAWSWPGFQRVVYFDKELQTLVEGITRSYTSATNVNVISTSEDRNELVFSVHTDTTGTETFLLSRIKGSVEKLAASQWKHLDKFPHISPLSINSNNKLLYGYLLKQRELRHRKNALVIRLHGGPWHQETLHVSLEDQFYIDRGFDVFKLNYRGSRGYGREYEWSGYERFPYNMIEDVILTAQHFKKDGYETVVLQGDSFGGYLASQAMCAMPEEFSAAIVVAAPSNLGDAINHLKTAAGVNYVGVWNAIDVSGASPCSSNIRNDRNHLPEILIVHGADDRVVPATHADIMQSILRNNKFVTEQVRILGEGHEFKTEQGRMAYFLAIDALLNRM